MIKIDEGKCLGCGSCSALAPEYFNLDYEKGKAIVKKQPKDLKKVKEAIEICPVGAIIEEKDEQEKKK